MASEEFDLVVLHQERTSSPENQVTASKNHEHGVLIMDDENLILPQHRDLILEAGFRKQNHLFLGTETAQKLHKVSLSKLEMAESSFLPQGSFLDVGSEVIDMNISNLLDLEYSQSAPNSSSAVSSKEATGKYGQLVDQHARSRFESPDNESIGFKSSLGSATSCEIQSSYSKMDSKPTLNRCCNTEDWSSRESPVFSSEVDTQTLTDHMETYIKLVPSFNKANAKTFSGILVKVLRRCLNHISLDDFFNLLNHTGTLDEVVNLPVDGAKIDRAVKTSSRLEAIKLCRLVLETFRLPTIVGGTWRPLLILNVLLFSIKFHEVLRTFFAIKVIFDIIKVSDSNEPDSCLAKISVYKAYFIICQKLLHKYPKNSRKLGFQHNFILSQSQIGKVMRVAFPNLLVKRLGTRKSSIFHYMGIKWNKRVVDDEIRLLIQLPLPDLHNKYKSSLQKISQLDLKLIHSSTPTMAPVLDTKICDLPVSLSNQKPIYSFVNFASKFPISGCYLRERERIPGNIPHQSQWSKTTILKSVEILKSYDFDIEPLIITLETSRFCGETVERFFESVLVMMHLFMDSAAADEVYLNFYLVISLVITPMALSSDMEITMDSKEQLRTLLTNFVKRFTVDYTGLSVANHNNLMSFVNIVTKLICCNKVSLSRASTSLVKRIVRVIGRGSNMEGDPQLMLDLKQGMLKIIYRSVISACNALNWEFLEESSRTNLTYQARFIKNITSRYMNFCLNLLEAFISIPSYMSDEDLDQPTYELAYHLCSQLSEVFHDIFMADDFVLLLPIKLIELMVNNITNEFQNVNFHRFGNLDHELANQTFKMWWVYSTAVQEYTRIISEVAALSSRVS